MIVATTSALHDDVTPDALGRQEHASNVQRLKKVLLIGLVTWLAAGVPGDVLLSLTAHGCDFGDLLRVRIATAVVIGLALFFVCDEQAPTPRFLHIIEVGTFALAAAATALFVIHDVGLASPTTAQLSCILLAQGTAFPRPWQRGAASLLTTWLAFVVVIALGLWLDPSLGEAGDVRVLATGVWSAAGSLVILVVGGHAAWALRRRAFAARHIGRYQLKKKLGAGGSGEVWLAWHAGLRRDVALKVLRTKETEELAAVDRAARLCHPNTVRVLDRGAADDNHWYYAMELVDGDTLRQLVDVCGPLSPIRAVHVTTQVARALAEAHGLGIVHRDVKPENVMIATIGREADFAKLCDFGSAAQASFAWAAPEQRYGEPVDARADVYALGGLLLFALTGQGPLGRPAVLAPADVRRVIDRCLEPDPAARYADASEVVRALASTAVAGRHALC